MRKYKDTDKNNYVHICKYMAMEHNKKILQKRSLSQLHFAVKCSNLFHSWVAVKKERFRFS